MTERKRRNPAQTSLATALSVRQAAGIPLTHSLCIFDLALSLGLEIRFLEIPSLEGIYCAITPPTVLVSSLRPYGRQRFTCAHELGHHIFKHGNIIDGVDQPSSNPEEQAANLFASYLLMPKLAVAYGFATRNIKLAKAQPEDIYRVSGWLGVGYETLLTHLESNLGILNSTSARQLKNHKPADIRKSIAGIPIAGELFVVDEAWVGRPIDLRVGDFAMIQTGLELESSMLAMRFSNPNYVLVEALKPGEGRISSPRSDWSASIRISAKGFSGRAGFRHLEDAGE